MEGDLILLLGIANIPLYKMIYETFFQETMRKDDAKIKNNSVIYSIGLERKSKDDGRGSLFLLLCILAVAFEFFTIEGTISIFIS
ncbi:hypothetical protein JHL18_05540 [Clostridium sp. YIM B02505]|uniref:Uncharacterized protein n=1 Tax=Clostridium yunnanense TaxID=2800325 RepID=A0ABS1EL79_9CLOT|nr:hypothetical protein [Clostridium yunnanense]MBK1810108.1 hypothetical protein [Clostridium yunnanense]